jgi:Asp-tRNA(Asn)/Glu-tRNA(Gln) amidotransferase A subunit family amidase
VLFAGWQPARDAAVISLLRSAGAVIMGKTVTAELAYFAPGKTRNPRNPAHTPGGSSSGSAAAVAAAMVPLALGTQTNGSVIRPAAFCGVLGYKPTHGRISRHGILHQSWLLDQVGVFASSVADAALLADELISYDGRDPSMRPFARPGLLKAVETPLARPPRIAFTRTPVWDQADDETRKKFTRLSEQWGMDVPTVELPKIFEDAHSVYKTILLADFALNFADIYRRGADNLSPILREAIETGMTVPAHEYNRAAENIPRFNAALEPLMQEFDALITPAAPGPAPAGIDTTGSPVFCTIWTLCGVPAVTLPLLTSASGLPIGVQIVAARGNDRRLLQIAAWLEGHVGTPH